MIIRFMEGNNWTVRKHWLDGLTPGNVARFGILLLTLFIAPFSISANDGAFFGRGNQLIPIVDSNISVKKEILRITKLPSAEKYDIEYVQIDVYYEFYNDTSEKEVLVGFEAARPSGDVNGWPIKGEHPYMKGFTVEMNGQNLDYGVTYYKKYYHVNGAKLGGDYRLTDEEANEGHDGNWIPFDYVYYFNANFKPGLNIIKHRYRLAISSGIYAPMQIEYVLTAANRWANNRIDDFTLILDLKDTAGYRIQKTFFDSPEQWTHSGTAENSGRGAPWEKRGIFIKSEGKRVVFKAKNFHPEGELKIANPRMPYILGTDPFDAKIDTVLPHHSPGVYYKAVDYPSYRIIRNLPYAINGYDFKNQAIKGYYSKQKWYKVDYQYKPVRASLDVEVRMWLEEIELINEKWKTQNK